jgi:LmbE family N-acetylglucosaminyl deacetylase
MNLFVPDGLPEAQALARTTHAGIVAHPDDLEILAFPAIRECYRNEERWFSGLVITNGSGSARSGPYAAVSDAEMTRIRAEEQRQAAALGGYAAVAQLGKSSADLKGAGRADVVRELTAFLERTQPSVLYTHNPADRHDTHVAAMLATLEACRALPAGRRPRRLLGGEVWRDLDWLCDADKVAEDAGGRDSLAAALIGVFDSQVSGGKRYDLAVLGRRRAHATYRDSHATDAASALCLSMDLTPLVADERLDVGAFVEERLARFRADVVERLGRLTGGSR